jgi:pantoate--beta-alanine ligase
VHVISSISDMVLARSRLKGSIGFVPTMGYLHEGHLSLMGKARQQTDNVIASIFVNPTQFGPEEDLDSYPRDFERDEKLAEEAGVDFIFYPDKQAMYPNGYASYVVPDGLDSHLCGAKRPGHFRGVMTIVLKLFNIIQPTDSYFGQKDIQQARILEQMTADFHLPIRMHIEPIVRERDGLAMSSRNVYLSPDEREAAVCLSRAIRLVERHFKDGEREAAVLLTKAEKEIQKQPVAKIDYVELVDYLTLAPIKNVTDRAILALAAYFGQTRLIDNTILE